MIKKTIMLVNNLTLTLSALLIALNIVNVQFEDVRNELINALGNDYLQVAYTINGNFEWITFAFAISFIVAIYEYITPLAIQKGEV